MTMDNNHVVGERVLVLEHPVADRAHQLRRRRVHCLYVPRRVALAGERLLAEQAAPGATAVGSGGLGKVVLYET